MNNNAATSAECGDSSFLTPRIPRQDDDYQPITVLRDEVDEAMSPEMHSCTLETFLECYTPFSPTPATIDVACAKLIDNCTIDVTTTGKDSRKITTRRWADFDRPPSEIDGRESKVFQQLQGIIDSLGEIEQQNLGGRPVKFQYLDCAHTGIEGETPGATFKVDAYFGLKSFISSGSTLLETENMAVIAEFKKKESHDIQLRNWSQLVSAASFIMNDDPCRMWMYGITIEDDEMSLWYFSRSHSVKSEPFDFTTDIKTFAHVFITFLLATEAEMGFDPTVNRVTYKDKIQYIYTIENAERQARKFLTLNPIYDPRSLSITGRKTRIWRVVELPELLPQNLDEVEGRGEYALKDVWLTEGSPTERDNLQEVFRKLEDFEDYPERPAEPFSQLLRDILRNKKYKNYFMEIVCDGRGFSTKRVPHDAVADPSILASSTRRMSKAEQDKHIVKGSSRNTYASSSTAESQSRRLPHDPEDPPRKFEVRRQYRLIYKDVGTALSRSPDFSSTISALRDALIAVVLMALVNWVHRDISAQNIIMVEQGEGRIVGKLSDLEYAKEFSENPKGGHDPKTGSPYFMPFELHVGRLLYPKLPGTAIDPSKMIRGQLQVQVPSGQIRKRGAPFYRYEYDLESLWWILLWLVLRIKHAPSNELLSQVFMFDARPSPLKESIFCVSESSRIYDAMHPAIKGECGKYIYLTHKQLLQCYKTDAIPYEDTASMMFMTIDELVTALKDVEIVFGDIPLPFEAPRMEARRKRSQQVHSKVKDEDPYIPELDEAATADDSHDGANDEDEPQPKRRRTGH